MGSKLSVWSFILLASLCAAPSVSAATSTRLTVPVGNNIAILDQTFNGQHRQIGLVSDSLSSTKVILTQAGISQTTPHYYPYGQAQKEVTNNPNDRYYTGQRKVSDDDSLYNYNARYYSPETGVFTQPDSVEGPNRFAYVKGNPIMKNDPSGHYSWKPQIVKGDELENYLLGIFKDNGKYLYNQDNKLNILSRTDQYDTDKDFYTNASLKDTFDANALGLAIGYIKRNPYNPQSSDPKDKWRFVRFFGNDLRESSPYSQGLLAHVQRANDAYEFSKIQPSLQENSKHYPMTTNAYSAIDKYRGKWWDHHARQKLTERFEYNNAICGDYAMFSSFAFSLVGINAGIVHAYNEKTSYSHAYNVINDSKWGSYEYEPQGGRIQPFFETYKTRGPYAYFNIMQPYEGDGFTTQMTNVTNGVNRKY